MGKATLNHVACLAQSDRAEDPHRAIRLATTVAWSDSDRAAAIRRNAQARLTEIEPSGCPGHSAP